MVVPLKRRSEGIITGAGAGHWNTMVGFLSEGRSRHEVSYVIFTDDTDVYAVNGTTGIIDYGGPDDNGGVDGANAAAVIQAAIDSVQVLGGGTVMVGTGRYTITATISLPGSIKLVGQIPAYSTHTGTTFWLANGANCVMIDTKAEEGVYSHFITIKDIWFVGNAVNQVGSWDIIDFSSARESYIERCYIYNASRDGFIGRDTVLHKCKVTNNYRRGIHAISDCMVKFCHVSSNVLDVAYDSGAEGQIHSGSGANKIISNHIHSSPYGSGIACDSTIEDIIIGNTVTLNQWYGIYLLSDDSIVSGNLVSNNSQRAVGSVHGIVVVDAERCVVSDNICFDKQGTETQDTGIFLVGDSDDNIITDNICWGNTDYGINVSVATCNRNLVRDNVLINNGVAPFNDAGTNTKLAVIKGDFPVSNVGGGAAAVAPVINTSPGGVDIDANDEFCYVHIPLQEEVQQVVRFKLWAYANVLEADAMRLRIVSHGATDNEPWSGNAVDVPNHPSESSNFAADDVIYWLVDAGDDAQIGTLAAQDLVELMAVGEIAGGADAATDALFGGWEIEYV